MTHLNLPYGKSLLPSTVGFDKLLTTIEEFDKMFAAGTKTTYPPYNIVKEGENHYTIEIAISGFKRDEIDIKLNKNKLTVSGAMKNYANTDFVQPREYLHKGIAGRNFELAYTLNDTVVVQEADIVDGILTIKLENIIPEEKKPRKIPIGKVLP
jgi:molecular chaperone IbpA